MTFSFDSLQKLQKRMRAADTRYGDFASTHEALGVASEEWDEFKLAVQANDLQSVAQEALDVSAVMIRLADQLLRCNYVHERSVK